MFFPNDFQFYAETVCKGQQQVDVIVRLLALLQKAFGLECWTQSTPTPVTADFVALEIEKSLRRTNRPNLNLPASFSIASLHADIRVLINTRIRAMTDFKKPEPRYWLQVIELLRPFTADLANCKNRPQVEPQDRIHRYGRNKPAACFGLEYYTEPLLANLGGKSHVLNTPAHRTSEFLDGVLIELVPGYYLDPQNPAHLEIQRRAMRHLGIDD
jgi:hypothetical protein